jgi:cyclopropane fatty-acyl-phospholipid synthase-like methyltransferase
MNQSRMIIIKNIKRMVHAFLMSSKIGRNVKNASSNFSFPGTAVYWERRYRKNGNSGNGSYGENACYKASIINAFVTKNNIKRVIDFGCGDGNQLKRFHFPDYIGFDVSSTALDKCRNIFKDDSTKRFFLYHQNIFTNDGNQFRGDLVLSLDVIFHLVEDHLFEQYIHHLFSASLKYVIIYAWDVEEEKKYHVRHRKFTQWIERNITDFQLIERVTENSFCDFFIYRKNINSENKTFKTLK